MSRNKKQLKALANSIVCSAFLGGLSYVVLQSVNESNINKSLSIVTMFITYNIFFAMHQIINTIEDNK